MSPPWTSSPWTSPPWTSSLTSRAGLPAPHNHAASQAHGSQADVGQPRSSPGVERPFVRVALVVPADAGAEEAADLEPLPPAQDGAPDRKEEPRVQPPQRA